MRVARYAVRRLAILPLAIAIVATLAFVVVNILPGDPARVIAGDIAGTEQIDQIRAQLGLDDPLPTRYWHYVDDLVHGSLGSSYYTRTAVTHEIWQRLPSTLELVLLAVLVGSVIGVALGAVGSYFSGRLPDRLMRSFVILAQSIPDFFLGLILIYLVFFRLQWAPSPVGQLGFSDEPPHRVTGSIMLDALIAGKWSVFVSAVKHAILPVVTLGIFLSAFVARITASVLGEALASDQVEFARACGLPERIVLGYAFKAARAPIITYVGLLVATLCGGAAIVETVFAWNGAGQWAVQGILRLDVPAVQGFIVVIGLLTLFVFIAVDLLVLALDPRVKYSEGR